MLSCIFFILVHNILENPMRLKERGKAIGNFKSELNFTQKTVFKNDDVDFDVEKRMKRLAKSKAFKKTK